RILIRTEVVRTICGDRVQPKGVHIGAHEVIRRRLAGGVGGVGSIRRLFPERAAWTERAIDLVGGYLKKSERFPRIWWKLRREATRRFEQDERADDVCVDEVLRAVDRSIDMSFCGNVQHRAGPGVPEYPLHCRSVGDVGLNECDPRILP